MDSGDSVLWTYHHAATDAPPYEWISRRDRLDVVGRPAYRRHSFEGGGAGPDRSPEAAELYARRGLSIQQFELCPARRSDSQSNAETALSIRRREHLSAAGHDAYALL